MRISDWSSDVCSSDLLQQLADFPIRGANVTENGEPVFGQPWKIFTVDGISIAVLALTYHSTDKTASAQNIAGLVYSSGIEATRRYLPEMQRSADIVMLLSHQGTATDRKLARELRSEEHTSELQSLMRISYAVFCL